MRRVVFLLLSFVLFGTLQAFSQPRQDEKVVFQEEPVRLDILSFASPYPDSVRTDLYVALPYTLFDFLRTRDNYLADYSVTVTVRDGSTPVIDRYFTYRINESIGEHSRRLEKGLSRADAEQVSFLLRPSMHYEVHLIFRDLHTRQALDTTVNIRTPNFRLLTPSISDLMLYRSRKGNRIVPAIGSDVSILEESDGGVFAETYHLAPDTTFRIVSLVRPIATTTDNKSDVLVRASSTVQGVKEGATPIFQSISFSDLWSGRYNLTTYVLPNGTDTSLPAEQLEAHAIAHSERIISVSMPRGIPLTTSDIDEAIEQLRLIATASEWDSLSYARSISEKREAIVEFWHKRASENHAMQQATDRNNRPMQIFYSRVEYCNAHFSYGSTPGWKTDRGRIYVALGPPATIERHNYEANQKPYELWEYYSPHVRYVFVDAYMLGDYRLIDSSPPPQGTFDWDTNE